MGSSHGYRYTYNFSLGDLSDIKSEMKSARVIEGNSITLAEMRTVFSICGSKREEDDVSRREIINNETFDFDVSDAYTNQVRSPVSSRLNEYWMTNDEITCFAQELTTFVKEMSCQRSPLAQIVVVVDFEVCTVQQAGEDYAAAKERAIEALKLNPLYLSFYQNFSRKPLNAYHLSTLPKVRVDNVDRGLALMRACPLCALGPRVGDQITKLCECGCAFHSHCIVRKLEFDNLCPTCFRQVYGSKYLHNAYIQSDSD